MYTAHKIHTSALHVSELEPHATHITKEIHLPCISNRGAGGDSALFSAVCLRARAM